MALTIKSATDYAVRLVAAWHAASATVEAYKAYEDTEDGIDIVNVSISVNGEFYGTMTVWVEPDGSLYGEI